ncbi:hypothetical protein PIB30_096329 [Stylosanthes scabra]|uniref:RPW8 domain-containing protein n=1 Tax=Stylosanthes scabra TaxID=79078 RepID=A0ABU6XSQ7_9FABA|nr:hypothetical protein [Stylosanthes scabra]
MEDGTKLVYKCSKICRCNFPARIHHQEQLAALVESLLRFFIIDMHPQTARDLKETLITGAYDKKAQPNYVRNNEEMHQSRSTNKYNHEAWINDSSVQVQTMQNADERESEEIWWKHNPTRSYMKMRKHMKVELLWELHL